ncbi:MAG: metalloprotease PmbA [Gammaproteobacteria bacterium]
MNAPATTDYNDPEAIERVALEVLARAREGGGEAEVAVSAGEGLGVTVRGGECETVEFERDKSLAVTLYLGGRKGSATTSDFSPGALAETVAAARQIAENGEVDEYAGLADPEYLATTVPDLDLNHPWAIDAPAAIELALGCEQVALAEDPRLRQSDGVSVNRYQGARAYANSHGFHGAYRGTRHSISAVMIAAGDDGAMQRGYWYSSARDPSMLEDAEAIGRRAAARTVAKLGAGKIATTELPVLFEPRVAAGLVGHLVSAISGGAQYRRASFLLDALGEAVLPASLDLVERPHLKGAAGSAPFDNDGVATAEKTIVAGGRLETYLLGAYAARRLGRTPTGNAGGVHNLILTPGERDLEALVAAQDRALLVTDLMGFGVNGVTGDYSRGASGFLIEGGEIARPVEEITIAGNLRDMLTGIVEVGSDVDESLNVRTGSLLIGRMAVAGS